MVGYFVAPTTTVGLGVGVINGKTETTTGSVTSTTAESSAFIIQPLVRKYWGIGGKFSYLVKLHYQ